MESRIYQLRSIRTFTQICSLDEGLQEQWSQNTGLREKLPLSKFSFALGLAPSNTLASSPTSPRLPFLPYLTLSPSGDVAALCGTVPFEASGGFLRTLPQNLQDHFNFSTVPRILVYKRTLASIFTPHASFDYANSVQDANPFTLHDYDTA